MGDGALAVAYHKVEDGRVALLHTDVPQERSGQGYGSRLAHGVFEALRRDGKRVIAKCPLYPPTPPAPRVRRAPRWLIADGPNVGAHSAFGRRYPCLSNACPKGISNFVGCVRSSGLLDRPSTAAASTLIEAIAPARRAARGQQRSSP
ncbi:N-acetyltransferase [Mesorhizobium sp. BR1-1-7]|uniref:N-acetyltransferase n=1 Tax=Mesorhizobium sp. BR1-1-7 TaxID=2876647 RepID=UPI001CC9FDCB|nr:N-acetyltransferase [Mesorhizobium sp. BR1-1-7]